MTDEAKRCVEILRYCSSGNGGSHCKGCPYYFRNTNEKPCINVLWEKSADLIESLSAELEQVEQERDESNRILAQVRAALESRIVERDQREIVKSCDNCTQAERLYNLTCSIEYCRDCRDFSKWKYNGVKD